MLEFIQIAIGGLVVGSIYAAIALGFSLVYRVTGAINLSQGGFALVAAMIGYSFAVAWGWPLLVAIPAAVVTTVIAGLVLARFTFVPALARLSNANVLMLTAGILTMIEGFSLVVWGSQPYATPPFSGEAPLAFGAILIPTQAFWVFGATALIIVALWFLIARTQLGKALRACAENPAAASLMGIDVPRMTLLSFGLATLIAALSGVIVAPTTSLQFDTGRLFTISGFVAAAIGGIASFPGAVIGGLFLGLVTQLSTAYISSLFSSAISLLILLIVLIWRPQGLIQGGVARRQDTRDEVKAAGHAAKLPSHLGWPLAALAVIVAALIPFVVTDNGIMSGLVIAAILFMTLMGLDVLMGYAGQVSLGQAGFMAIGGYTSGYLAINYDIAPVLSILAGIGVSLSCALVLSVVTLRLRGLYLALATLAFGLLVDSCAVGFLDITGGPSGSGGHSLVFGRRIHLREPARDVLSRARARRHYSGRAGRRDALRFRPCAQGDPFRPDGGRRARHQRRALQVGGVPDQRHAGLARGQPLCVLLQFSGAGNGRHLALARAGGDADHRRREHAGRRVCSARCS